VTYQTVTGVSCGPNCSDITVTLHTETQYVCTGDFVTYTGGYYGSYYDPGFTYSGGGNVFSSINSFNLRTAINDPYSTARTQFSQTLKDAANAVGLAAGLRGLTVDGAQAIAGAIGADLTAFSSSTVKILGRSVAILGFATSAGALYMGIAEDGFTLDKDGWNAAQTILGGVGVVLAFTSAAPIFAVAVGVVSIGIAIGTTNVKPEEL
jgi:hypothetical protein